VSTPGGGYQLSAADNERIFREDIVADLLSHQLPQHRPVAVVLVGQPGAGKSRVADVLGAALDEVGGYVEVDSDLYKPYHPAYPALMALDGGRDMALHTRADGRVWMAKVQEYVREHRLNALVHDTVQDPDHFAEALRTYRAAGFDVEVAVLGVPEALSRQGIVHRFYEQVRDRGAGRLTVPANAAASYVGILGGAQLVDEHHLADVVAVYRRGEADPRYRNELSETGQWAAPPGLRAAIETERARPLSAAEAEAFQATHAMLRAALGPEWATELDAIADLALPLLGTDPPAAVPADPYGRTTPVVQGVEADPPASPPRPPLRSQDALREARPPRPGDLDDVGGLGWETVGWEPPGFDPGSPGLEP
jgi:UDP-N-acetylglucosamine kinase